MTSKTDAHYPSRSPAVFRAHVAAEQLSPQKRYTTLFARTPAVCPLSVAKPPTNCGVSDPSATLRFVPEQVNSADHYPARHPAAVA